MAVYEYRCQGCGAMYDILHLGKERREDIICPHCESTDHKKLLSVFNASSASSASADRAPMPSCTTGTCGIGGGCFN
jgi:putative FmdB family regulatory protein